MIALLGCGNPSGPSSGNLSVSVLGLPGGSAASITVTGPGGYNQTVPGTQLLSDLPSGTYTVAASQVTVGSTIYVASPPSQTVAVAGATAVANITYSAGSGNLLISINGLGTSSSAAVTVTGPNSYSRSITATQTLAGLTPGSYTVAAQDVVAAGGTPHTASPATQDVSVTGTGTQTANVNYAPPSSGTLNLRVAGFYVTQSVQTFAGGVPLVQNRDGYLRVFVVANRTNTAAPTVRVRIYNNVGTVVSTVLIPPPPGLSVPTTVDESSLGYSWNTPVSGTLIQPGFRIDAEVDPAGAIAESDETDNILAPPAPTVRTIPTLNVTLVPVIQSANGNTGDVSNPTALLKDTRSMHPIDGVNVAVRAAYTTSTTLQADGTGWITVLGELDARRVADNSTRYYYGVAKVSYTSGVAGVAYIGNGTSANRAALGWDYSGSSSVVAAHELGHNWGRNHAPCGSPAPGSLDPAFPQPDGSIGAYGVDVATQTLKPASTSDIMGYCNPKWIGDYNYKAVMDYFSTASPLRINSPANQMVQPCLLVWGHIRDGEMVLEPAFQVNTRPSLPERAGSYSVEARAEDGSTVFALSFEPKEIADLPGNQRNFVFAVPLSAAQAAQLSTLRFSGQGRQTISSAPPSAAASAAQLQVGALSDSVEVRRVAAGRVGLRWNASAHPMVMVRDAKTGEVLSFARGGEVQLSSFKGPVDLVLSDGVRSRIKHLVNPR